MRLKLKRDCSLSWCFLDDGLVALQGVVQKLGLPALGQAIRQLKVGWNPAQDVTEWRKGLTCWRVVNPECLSQRCHLDSETLILHGTGH